MEFIYRDRGSFWIERVVAHFSHLDANRIFLIHGRDEGPKYTVAGFFENLGLEPVILAEQPSEGRTIIEKLEQHAKVGCALASLMPDDAASLQGNDADLNPGARQNVIFELGFFSGRIGGKRVYALTKGDVELPSDCTGVVYIPFDNFGGWKGELIRELESARIPTNGPPKSDVETAEERGKLCGSAVGPF